MKNKLILVVIILISFVLRFWDLGNYPALNADEASLGYNAYSLIETGKDEHGNPWPIHFQSFNDYKPGGYVYLVIPFISVFGLNEWAVRLPGALAGVGTIVVMFYLCRELLPKKEFGNLPNLDFVSWKLELGHLAGLLLAINPWHIHFSRGAWEVNVSTFFIVLGLLLFIKSLNNSKYILFSLLSFVASLYTYHAARIIIPLLGIGLLTIYWKDLLKIWRSLAVPLVIAVLVLLPLGNDLLGPAGISRVSGVGLLADPGPLSRVNEQRGEHNDFNGLYTKLFHNKFVNYGLSFIENYTEHFHGEFLFLSGDDIQRNKVPETGQMYGFEFLLIAIGLWQLAQKNSQHNTHNSKLILWWLVIAPAAAALTFQSPHALRSQNMVIPLTIISSFGLYLVLEWIRKTRSIVIITTSALIVTSVLIWSTTRYTDMYYNHLSKEYPYSSQYGIKELVSYLGENHSDKKVVITTRYDQPYILFLFYGVTANPEKYSPAKFQYTHTLTDKDNFGFSTVPSFDRFTFEPIDFQKTKEKYPGNIIVGTTEEIPSEANIIMKIYGSNQFEYFNVVAN
jgi:4-amino-4-deoxy-L-arabinose transferase-like glycosyltransferase